MTAAKPGLLFLCVANSARSQMGEALARRLAGDRVRVQSAGSHPSHVHRLATDVLAEIGVSTDGQRSKSVREIDPASVDVVITLCAEEECPLFLGDAERLHWPLPDPVGAGSDPRDGFRYVRDELDRRIKEWLAERGWLAG